jgi:cysteinyl-tRNA synthetase
MALRDVSLPSKPLTLLVNYTARFKAAMDDDINTPEVIPILFELAREINKFHATNFKKAQQLAYTLHQLGRLLGLLENDPSVFLQGDGVSVEQIEALLTERDEARASKNWAKSDRLRLELENLGVIIEDTAHGTVWRKG